MKRFAFGTLLTLLFVASPALASTINCNTNVAACDAIELGGGPYVRFVDNVFNRYMDIGNSSVVSADIQTAGVSHNMGVGSLATGILKLFSQSLSTFQSSAQASITAQDYFTVTGPGAGQVTITAVFQAHGNANLVVSPNPGGLQNGGGAVLEMCGPGGSFACGGDQFARGGFPPSFVAYNGVITSDINPSHQYLERIYTFSVTPGTPFSMFYRLTASEQNGSTIDMFNTGNLTFNLPAGYSITSRGGYGAQAPPPPDVVPEPATLTLVGAGLVLLARRARRRR